MQSARATRRRRPNPRRPSAKDLRGWRRAAPSQPTLKKSTGDFFSTQLRADISTPEGFARATEEGLTSKVCPRFVASVVRTLEGLI